MFHTNLSRNADVIRLFCLPHAGAGPSAYRGWAALLGPEIELAIVQLPGREARFHQPAYLRLEQLAGDLTEAMLASLAPGQRFAVFGNSLGGLIAFEVLHEMRRRGGPPPSHFFVSATGAPHLPPLLPPFGPITDSELVKRVSERYGGIPKPVLEDEEFLSAVIGALRADLVMLDGYVRRQPEPFHCPLTAFGGRRDQTVPPEHLEGWRVHTTGEFTRVLLDEDHLYLQSAREDLTAYIRKVLTQEVCAGMGSSI